MSEERLLQLSRATKCDVDIPVPAGLKYLPYQPSVVEYSRLQPAGTRGVLLADDMGLGKTVQAIAWMNAHQPRRVLLLCPATLRLNWFRELKKWLVSSPRIVIADSTIPKWRTEKADILIVNYDILARLIKWRQTGPGVIQPISFGALDCAWDLTIADECFPYETSILTDKGNIPIGEIVEQELPVSVATLNLDTREVEYKPILRWLRRYRLGRMVRVKHNGGTVICTEDHKIWTEEEGYVRALGLNGNHHLLTVRQGTSDAVQRQGYREVLWKELCCASNQCSAGSQGKDESRASEKAGPEELPGMQQGIRVQVDGRHGQREASILQRILCQSQCSEEAGAYSIESRDYQNRAQSEDWNKEPGGGGEDASEQSYEGPCYSGKGFAEEQGSAIPGRRPWWQWLTYQAANDISAGATIADRVLYTDAASEGTIRASANCLQSGFGISSRETGNRGRWKQSQGFAGPGVGCPENGSINRARVEGIEILEQPGLNEYGSGDSPDTFVYDLEIADNHNYFANGALVSNCHLSRNPQSQRGALTFALSARSKFTLFLTGTPIDNRPEELFPFANRLDPKTFPNRFSFRQTYCTTRSRLPQLQRIVRSRFLIRRLKSEVLTDLPPKIRQVIEIAPDDAATKQAIASERAAWERREDQVIALKVQVELAKAGAATDYETSVRSLGQAVSASWSEIAKLRKETAMRKVPYVISHLRSFLDDDPAYKVAVFGWHIEPIHRIASAFRGRVAVVTGEVSAAMKVVDGRETSDRMMAVDHFQEDPSCQVFLGNMEAAGVGLTLTAASHAILYEQAWKPSVIAQVEARLHRYGQVNSVLIQHLVLQDSIDARMAKAVVEKQDLIDATLDKDDAAALEEEAVIPTDEAATSGLTRAAVERAAKEISSDEIASVKDHLTRITPASCNRIDSKLRAALLAGQMTPPRAVLARKIVERYVGNT